MPKETIDDLMGSQVHGPRAIQDQTTRLNLMLTESLVLNVKRIADALEEMLRRSDEGNPAQAARREEGGDSLQAASSARPAKDAELGLLSGAAGDSPKKGKTPPESPQDAPQGVSEDKPAPGSPEGSAFWNSDDDKAPSSSRPSASGVGGEVNSDTSARTAADGPTASAEADAAARQTAAIRTGKDPKAEKPVSVTADGNETAYEDGPTPEEVNADHPGVSGTDYENPVPAADAAPEPETEKKTAKKSDKK